MARRAKTVMEPAGIWNDERPGARRRSMVVACWREKVCCVDDAVITRMPAAQMGPMRITDLSSSTRCTVLRRHGFGTGGGDGLPEEAASVGVTRSPSVTTAARSKKLHAGGKHTPELVRVHELAVHGDGRVELVVLVQPRGVHDVARRQPPLLDGGDHHLREPRERAARRLEPPVHRVPRDEGRDGDAHAEGRHAEAPPPPDVVLNVHHRRDGEQHRRAVAEVVPVEEAPAPGALRRPRLVELVGAERHDARPVPAGAHRVEEQGNVQHCQLPRRRFLARRRATGLARRRAEQRQRRRHRQQRHADLVDDGGGGDGPEPADAGVGEEGADERRRGGGAAEVGQRRGGLGQRHVQLRGEVRQHVRREPHHGELLRHLVSCAARTKPTD
ncbi:hypothetical protein SEVIR_4G117850v4 [Setaria viridis]